MTFQSTAGAWFQDAAWRGLKMALLLAALSLATGCTAGGPGPLASQGSGPTIAFESVDGPPRQVFERLVRVLDTESASRNLSIVTRGAQAAYRVRSYYAARIADGGSSAIAWVWDVYDRDEQRVLRLRGEEPVGKGGDEGWAAADDPLLRRMTQTGLSGLAGLIADDPPRQGEPAPQIPETAGPALAFSAY